MLNRPIEEQIDELQQKYARALDRKDMKGWLECFGKSGGYICTTAENWDNGLPVGMMLDSTPARLRDRVKFIEKAWVGTFEDYATRHFVQRVSHVEKEDGTYEVETNFMVSYASTNVLSAILGTGVYRDTVVLEEDGAKFQYKAAVLDSAVAPRYLVYPI